jgi:hypothetical protein
MVNKSNSDRSLVNLERSGSTARILNLLSVHRRQAGNLSLQDRPMFQSKALNQAIILKHRLRPHERELFSTSRTTATKVIIPLDRSDLRAGGQSFFIGEERVDHILETHFSDNTRLTAQDHILLEIFDDIPSMDPFLLRETLARNGYLPALEYFNISEADLLRMREFVESEMAGLTNLVAGNDGRGATDFTQKLLAETPDASFAPLREALRMDAGEYRDGIFAWRGLLYYKWISSSTLRESSKTCVEISNFMPAPPRSFEATEYIRDSKNKINTSISRAVGYIIQALSDYDESYNRFLTEERPSEFRDFLLNAPATFVRLGEVIGSLQHINSFWAFRMGALNRARITEADFVDILIDFMSSLAFEPEGSASAQPARVRVSA